MKRIAILTLILLPFISAGQVTTIALGKLPVTGFTWAFPIVKSKTTTTVLNIGDLKCEHQWAVKINSEISNMSCAVNHGATGCPDSWGHDFRICTKCLRHEELKETRWVEQPKDEYAEALKKLKP